MSYRGLPYFFEVGSQTFRNDYKISRSQTEIYNFGRRLKIQHQSYIDLNGLKVVISLLKKILVKKCQAKFLVGFVYPASNKSHFLRFFSILSWNNLIFFFRFFAIFAPYPAIYPVCIRPMTLDRENSWLKPLAGWPLKTGFENLNSGAGGTVQDLPMCPCTSWCSIGHMWHRHQNCKRSLNNILYIYTFTFLSYLAINNQICY